MSVDFSGVGQTDQTPGCALGDVPNSPVVEVRHVEPEELVLGNRRSVLRGARLCEARAQNSKAQATERCYRTLEVRHVHALIFQGLVRIHGTDGNSFELSQISFALRFVRARQVLVQELAFGFLFSRAEIQYALNAIQPRSDPSNCITKCERNFTLEWRMAQISTSSVRITIILFVKPVDLVCHCFRTQRRIAQPDGLLIDS